MQGLGMNKFVNQCPAFVVVLEEPTKLKVSVSSKFKDQSFAPIDVGLSLRSSATKPPNWGFPPASSAAQRTQDQGAVRN
jgi:hypothetical protein